MKSKLFPEGSDFRSPLFVSPLPYHYRVSFHDYRNRSTIITYSSPHEIILNLTAFLSDDRITYITRIDNEELFTITVDRFRFMIAEFILDASQDKLELLYMRLLLTNQYSKAIIDRGQFRQHDQTLRKYLLTLRGGTDSYLAYEDRRVILYFKYRRLSTIHLLAVIEHWNEQNDIHINHINIPTTMANQALLFECLRVELKKQQFRTYRYDPIEEDNLQPTNIVSQIIQILNQLNRES